MGNGAYLFGEYLGLFHHEVVMIAALIDIALILLVFSSVNFTLSIILKRNDIADVAWGVGFIIVCMYCLRQFPVTESALMIYTAVIIWGIRSSCYF